MKPDIDYCGEDKRVVRWKENGQSKYALNSLASAGGQVRPPGKRPLQTIDEILEHPRTLVIGERGGGARTFTQWFMGEIQPKNTEKKEWCCVSVRGDRWEPLHFQFSSESKKEDKKLSKASGNKEEVATSNGETGPKDRGAAERLKRTATDFLMDFAEGAPARRSKSLVEWAESLPQDRKVCLLIRDLGGLGERSAAEAAQALRLVGEALEQKKKIQDRFRLLVISASENQFEDRYDASGFAIMCQRYRLPWLNRDEIAELAADDEFAEIHNGHPIRLSGDDETLDEIVKVTGGQPLLVQSVLAELVRLGSALNKKVVEKVYRRLRDQPPNGVRWWREDLQVRLNASPGLVEALRDYVSGVSRREKDLPKIEHSLMYSGWIRFDESIQRWKIASKIHQHLAHGVLSKGGWR